MYKWFLLLPNLINFHTTTAKVHKRKSSTFAKKTIFDSIWDRVLKTLRYFFVWLAFLGMQWLPWETVFFQWTLNKQCNANGEISENWNLLPGQRLSTSTLSILLNHTNRSTKQQQHYIFRLVQRIWNECIFERLK